MKWIGNNLQVDLQVSDNNFVLLYGSKLSITASIHYSDVKSVMHDYKVCSLPSTVYSYKYLKTVYSTKHPYFRNFTTSRTNPLAPTQQISHQHQNFSVITY